MPDEPHADAERTTGEVELTDDVWLALKTLWSIADLTSDQTRLGPMMALDELQRWNTLTGGAVWQRLKRTR